MVLQGAMVGLLASLIFTLWLGMGAQVYKPPVWKAPVSTEFCPEPNITTTPFTTTAPAFTVTTEAAIPASEK